MNTHSHFLMTAVLDRACCRVPIVKSAFLMGSVAPDLPLWLLSIGGLLYYRYFLGWETAAAFQRMFDELFFQNPLWIVPHNVLHAPLVLLAGLGIVWRTRRNIGSRSRWCFWFFVACLLHSGVDILTHVDDGPLIFFPFDWQTRFQSTVSYWDDRHHAQRFQVFEQTANLVFLLYLLIPCWYRWFRQVVRH
ncbi:MAG: metal-dependent hydrolase [Synechococcales bacterium]|nr:metal-dependent hydrolase [Synechococcales bacterium]